MHDLISLCIPCMNRTSDLKAVMPSILKAARVSPPVQVAILDYNTQDDLAAYLVSITNEFTDGVSLNYLRYEGHSYFHMAHARNLSVLASIGDYVVISSCDIKLDFDFFTVIREHIERDNPAWMNFMNEMGVVIIERNEFINAGGFDERFEFYGSEDKDLYLRLLRRGAQHSILPGKKFYAITTPDAEKIKNYREPLSKAEMDKRGKVFYWQNIAEGVMVANLEGWGAWN